jgi:hypothetical protein
LRDRFFVTVEFCAGFPQGDEHDVSSISGMDESGSGGDRDATVSMTFRQKRTLGESPSEY